MIALAHTLHGYDRGHRLLARAGDVSEDELALLDRLSDLSGYLPSGVTFDHYYTGFPCGRHYAFACTWLDVGAKRGGTVLTHTLLVPLPRAGELSELFSLARHRRPTSAADREPYERPLPARASVAAATPPAPTPERARDALALYAGQRDRPVLWMERAQPLDVIALLWQRSAPEWRRRFAFCSFSLQERAVDRTPFDFLALPPEAQGAFHRRAGSTAWWRDGELGEPSLRALPIVDVLIDDPSAIETLRQRCRALDLPMVAGAGDLAALRQFLAVRGASRDRITAARARVELLGRLWPRARDDHAEWQGALDALVAMQNDR